MDLSYNQAIFVVWWFLVGSGFAYLPQCLHQIAECYHLKDEDERGIQFLKAEKIYYEAALIDTQKIQQKIGKFKLLVKRKHFTNINLHK